VPDVHVVPSRLPPAISLRLLGDGRCSPGVWRLYCCAVAYLPN
jgi:hypothetical protein